ncbi:C40 family peptidase [Flexivirga meconopsidis]|uniref:C40 family peptidase n=1 Tax=Flexivirga meconopsidis TaxID=2977121 RepID=UPI0022404338|nr:NlpC/P60 family protein [Flexivirga meconopsidis]
MSSTKTIGTTSRPRRRLRRGICGVALVSALAGVGAVSTGGAAHAADSHDFPAKVDLNGRLNIGEPADAPGHIENQYLQGTQVPVVCQQFAGADLWDKTADNTWVPDKYLTTGTDGRAPGVPDCNGGTTTDPVHGRNDGPAGPQDGTRDEKIARVLDAARSQVGQGLSYSWGAGGKGGPSFGIADASPGGYNDYDVFGFDCSGFTLYAYWKGAGVDITDYSGTQYDKFPKVSTSSLLPGDLVFKGAGGSEHVGIYLGDGQVAQAAPPRGTDSVRIDTFNPGEWLDTGVRPIA